ncbi:hypothetical protein [Rubripirellula reticaptiva]|uniref:Uncharacterized protein n=1 Tax=Rubripirellula reticaptiva TaxID=2528013 RepID=A0A5C6EW68_9BACT|nr:hypothetical protein [Rubripirellula reticaptiva]TWU51471.1 hypothetical protein Poly59_30630 [Rubripirellula reticaptiva]
MQATRQDFERAGNAYNERFAKFEEFCEAALEIPAIPTMTIERPRPDVLSIRYLNATYEMWFGFIEPEPHRYYGQITSCMVDPFDDSKRTAKRQLPFDRLGNIGPDLPHANMCLPDDTEKVILELLV